MEVQDYDQTQVVSIADKIKAILALTKLRLSFLVVLSAAICFAIGSKEMNWEQFTWLILGGFLVTGSSNAFNQVIERELDKLMQRTQSRPLPSRMLTIYEALMVAACTGSLGITILYFKMNALSGILGALALLLYTLAYTPLKRITPFAVFVGAIPGAIPPMLGYVAATSSIDIYAILLFVLQFIWQFPHFWAIAWILDEDYKRAGFKMLPTGEKDKRSAFQVMVYAFSLIPLSFLPHYFGLGTWFSSIVLLIAGLLFSQQSLRLYKDCSDESAKKLMFGSFVYLPVVQLTLLIDKLIFL